MTRNSTIKEAGLAPASLPGVLNGRSVVLTGLMGAGKSSIGRRLAARLGLPFLDADAEIEAAAGSSIPELFERYGERAFRDGERRVLRRVLAGDPTVLATGGGAFLDPETRRLVRESGVSIWLRCPLEILVKRVSGRTNRPLLADGNPAQILEHLMRIRGPIYAEADITVDCGDESADATTSRVLAALMAWRPPRRLSVARGTGSYDVLIGPGLLRRAGTFLAPILEQKRVVIVTDETVAKLHLPSLQAALSEIAVATSEIIVPPGERSKSMAGYAALMERLLDLGVERRTSVIALGGGVVGDLSGFAAATALRGLPLVQMPTTLLAQVDSSVGGKTGINMVRGKNLVGAFHQPRLVLADVSTLSTLPVRELRAGYAEVVKAGLIGDAGFFAWCEQNGPALIEGNSDLLAEAILRASAFKARVVGEDEREEKPADGRALLNLGHTFAHALERETGYGDALLHGEAVAIGLGLACRLSARLGVAPERPAERVKSHLAAVGLPAELSMLNRRFSAANLLHHMQGDKKVRDGVMTFVLVRGIGEAYTSRDVPAAQVLDLLASEGCVA
ncbi:MAG: 3-dehydroquinate synthase [Acetobacteraceae bacterium]